MNVIYKSKSDLRSETADSVEQFLARGGVVEIVKSRKAPKMIMRGKSSRSFTTGTSGFATGFPQLSQSYLLSD